MALVGFLNSMDAAVPETGCPSVLHRPDIKVHTNILKQNKDTAKSV